MYENQYYNTSHEASYAGARNLLRVNRKGRPLDNNLEKERIYDWLSNQDAFTLHQPIRKKFPRLHYSVSGMDQLWEMDLCVLKNIEKFNDGYSYILVVIDAVSKFIWLEPLRDKTAKSTLEGLKKILKRAEPRKPYLIQGDSGGEFLGSVVQTFLKKNNIQFRFTRNPDIKAALVERVMRTIKERMFRYFTHKNTKRYIDILQDIAKAYNFTIHTSTKMRPVDVTYSNAHLAYKNIQKRLPSLKKKFQPKFAVGMYVRISRTKGTFEKGYEQNYSEEVFTIHRILRRQGIFIYELKDLNGEVLDGFFYPEELIRVGNARMTEEFQIEKVLETKGRGANKQHLVKWVGFPHKFNSWVKASTISNI